VRYPDASGACKLLFAPYNSARSPAPISISESDVMEIKLFVSSSELEPEEVQRATRKLEQALRDEAGADVALATTEAAGTKGDIPLWGQIIMTLIGSGGVAVTAIKVLGDYVKKNRKIEVKVKTPNGEMTIKTENADSASLVALLQPLLTNAAEAKQLPDNQTKQLSQ
jgi:hypothetical protein